VRDAAGTGTLPRMVDIDAAVGFVVARGDWVDRARLSWARAGIPPADEVLEHVEAGQLLTGGWPAQEGDQVASVDATCYRLGEIDSLGGLGRAAAILALDWLANHQRRDGCWEEHASLAGSAPAWARPGDPEARFFLTAGAAYWLAAAAQDDEAAPAPAIPMADDAADITTTDIARHLRTRYLGPLGRAAEAIRDRLHPDGTWPGFLAAGWHAAAVLRRIDWYYEAARILVVLGDRARTMSPADAGAMAVALRRLGLSNEDPVLTAARARLEETQRPDGSWRSDLDGVDFNVHTTLTGLRALL
jgi:hypothetical protein